MSEQGVFSPKKHTDKDNTDMIRCIREIIYLLNGTEEVNDEIIYRERTAATTVKIESTLCTHKILS